MVCLDEGSTPSASTIIATKYTTMNKNEISDVVNFPGVGILLCDFVKKNNKFRLRKAVDSTGEEVSLSKEDIDFAEKKQNK